MKLIYDHKNDLIRFGVEQIKKSLERKGIEFGEQFEYRNKYVKTTKGIIVRKVNRNSEKPDDQEFRIKRHDNLIVIEGSGSRGAMYGCFEWAEQLMLGNFLEEGDEIEQKPVLPIRGVKFKKTELLNY